MQIMDKAFFEAKCLQMAKEQLAIGTIIEQFGIPPFYCRPFEFATLVQIILEQQVSLASGRAVYEKLQLAIEEVNPVALLGLDVQQLRQCSVSRQKAGYLHHLSQLVVEQQLILESLPALPDASVKQLLMQVKGIGPWTADVVLMLCLRRPDLFPTGDVALMNSVKVINDQPDWTIEDIAHFAEVYKPYRTVAAYCYWHAYIQRKNIVLHY